MAVPASVSLTGSRGKSLKAEHRPRLGALRKAHADLAYAVVLDLRHGPGQAIPFHLVADHRCAADFVGHEARQVLRAIDLAELEAVERRHIGQRKIPGLAASGAQKVVTACPGCIMQLQDSIDQAGLAMTAVHLLEVIDEALDG